MKGDKEIQDLIGEFEDDSKPKLETFEVSKSALGDVTVYSSDGVVKDKETTIGIAMSIDSATMAKLLLAGQKKGLELINKR